MIGHTLASFLPFHTRSHFLSFPLRCLPPHPGTVNVKFAQTNNNNDRGGAGGDEQSDARSGDPPWSYPNICTLIYIDQVTPLGPTLIYPPYYMYPNIYYPNQVTPCPSTIGIYPLPPVS